jgi:hypothetical protein
MPPDNSELDAGPPVKHPCFRYTAKRRTRMNPSGPPIQQIQDSVRATWRAGDLCVVSRPRSRSGIPLNRRPRRPRVPRLPQSHLNPQRLPASHGHPHLDRIGAFSRFVAKLDAEPSIDDWQFYDCRQVTSGEFVNREQSEPWHSWQGLGRQFGSAFPSTIPEQDGRRTRMKT